MNPEQDRLLCLFVALGRPHIQILAVLRGRPEPMRRHDLAHGLGLVEHRADHAVAAGFLHALPGLDWLGHLKPPGSGVADAVEMIDAVVVESPQLALCRLDDGRRLRRIEFLCHDAASSLLSRLFTDIIMIIWMRETVKG